MKTRPITDVSKLSSFPGLRQFLPGPKDWDFPLLLMNIEAEYELIAGSEFYEGTETIFPDDPLSFAIPSPQKIKTALDSFTETYGDSVDYSINCCFFPRFNESNELEDLWEHGVQWRSLRCHTFTQGVPVMYVWLRSKRRTMKEHNDVEYKKLITKYNSLVGRYKVTQDVKLLSSIARLKYWYDLFTRWYVDNAELPPRVPGLRPSPIKSADVTNERMPFNGKMFEAADRIIEFYDEDGKKKPSEREFKDRRDASDHFFDTHVFPKFKGATKDSLYENVKARLKK